MHERTLNNVPICELMSHVDGRDQVTNMDLLKKIVGKTYGGTAPEWDKSKEVLKVQPDS